MAKNLPTNGGDTGSILGPGGSHIAVGQLSCHTPITEAALQLLKPMCLEPVPYSKGHHDEKLESSPLSPQLEKAHAQQQRPSAAKMNK